MPLWTCACTGLYARVRARVCVIPPPTSYMYYTLPYSSAMKHIRVNSVSPGWTWTREVDKACGGDRASKADEWGRYSMLRRLASTVEVARPVLFLLSKVRFFGTSPPCFFTLNSSNARKHNILFCRMPALLPVQTYPSMVDITLWAQKAWASRVPMPGPVDLFQNILF